MTLDVLPANFSGTLGAVVPLYLVPRGTALGVDRPGAGERL